MNTLVIYDTKYGNTERVARAIARGAGSLGSVRVLDTTEAASPGLAERPDLLLVGGPTQRRTMSPELRRFVDALPLSLHGVPAAAFDTRYRGLKVIMGSAAAETASRLADAGASRVVPAESFYVGRSGPMELQQLEEGELDRAEAWGRSVAAVADRAARPVQ